MGTKIAVLVGLGVGYVLGARAGRERYEKIREKASKLRRFPIVAKPLDKAGDQVSSFVRAQGERVTDKVADAVKERLFGMPTASTPPDASANTSPETASTSLARSHEVGAKTHPSL